jgi:hypothetical protein
LTAIDDKDGGVVSQGPSEANNSDSRVIYRLFAGILLFAEVFMDTYFFQISQEGSGARERLDLSPL